MTLLSGHFTVDLQGHDLFSKCQVERRFVEDGQIVVAGGFGNGFQPRLSPRQVVAGTIVVPLLETEETTLHANPTLQGEIPRVLR